MIVPPPTKAKESETKLGEEEASEGVCSCGDGKRSEMHGRSAVGGVHRDRRLRRGGQDCFFAAIFCFARPGGIKTVKDQSGERNDGASNPKPHQA